MHTFVALFSHTLQVDLISYWTFFPFVDVFSMDLFSVDLFSEHLDFIKENGFYQAI